MKRTVVGAVLWLIVACPGAWAANHWVDITTSKTTKMDATANYVSWGSLTADGSGNVTKLRISIREYGSPTEIRLGLYDQGRKKIGEGTAVVLKAGYQEVAVPPTPVTQGKTYYIATQAASNMLYKFDCGATTGGFEAPNAYSGGFPASLPGGWGNALFTGGLYIQ